MAFSKLRICGNSFNKWPNPRELSRGGVGWGVGHTGVYLLDSTADHQSQPRTARPHSSWHFITPPTVPCSCPPVKCLSDMFRGGFQLVVSGGGRRGRREKREKELREPEQWLQSCMTQSGCIHAPGENTQSMYQNTPLHLTPLHPL